MTTRVSRMMSATPGYGEAWREVRSTALGVVFRVPVSLVVQADDDALLALTRPAGPEDFEAVIVTRRQQRGGDTDVGWHFELSRLAADGGWRDILLAPLQPYPIAGYTGAVALMRCTDGAGVVTGATLWCGQVESDTVTVLYLCGLAREPFLAATTGQLLGSLAFTARRRTRGPVATSYARTPNPRVLFAVNLAIAVILVLIGLLLHATG
jgi:hypothetical protein